MDTLTRALDGTTRFYVDGVELTTDELSAAWDFDGNGDVTKADAQALLNFVTTGAALTANSDAADLSGDGSVTTYDVHLFLKALYTNVTIPAGGSVTVDVTMELSDGEKARLDAENPNGGYVEAFVFASPVSDTANVLPELRFLRGLSISSNCSTRTCGKAIVEPGRLMIAVTELANKPIQTP